jgi:hypothetical protein
MVDKSEECWIKDDFNGKKKKKKKRKEKINSIIGQHGTLIG